MKIKWTPDLKNHLEGTSGQVEGVPFEEYFQYWAEHFYEWADGTATRITPVNTQHDELRFYVRTLLDVYSHFIPSGRTIGAPFLMHLPLVGTWREPDIQFILKPNQANLNNLYMNGPADICVEIVSEESVQRDYQEKFSEYERGGIGEYWIIDPLLSACHFYRQDTTGRFILQNADTTEFYRTPVLPNLTLHLPTLWLPKLPTLNDTIKNVLKMLLS